MDQPIPTPPPPPAYPPPREGGGQSKKARIDSNYPIDNDETLLEYTERLKAGETPFKDHTNFEHIIDLLDFGIARSNDDDPETIDSDQNEMDMMFRRYIYLAAARKSKPISKGGHQVEYPNITPYVQWVFKTTYSIEITLPKTELAYVLEAILNLEGASNLSESKDILLISKNAGYHFAENVGTSKGDDTKCCIKFSSYDYEWLRRAIVNPLGKHKSEITKHDPFVLSQVSHIDDEICQVDDFLYTPSKTDSSTTYVLRVLQKYLVTQRRTGSGIMFKTIMRDLKTKQMKIMAMLGGFRKIQFKSRSIQIAEDIWEDRDGIFNSTSLSEYANKLLDLIVSEHEKYQDKDDFGAFLREVATKLYICHSLRKWTVHGYEAAHDAFRLWKVLKRCIRNLAFNLTMDSLTEMLTRIGEKGFYGQFNVGAADDIRHQPTLFEDVVNIAASFTDMTLLRRPLC